MIKCPCSWISDTISCIRVQITNYKKVPTTGTLKGQASFAAKQSLFWQQFGRRQCPMAGEGVDWMELKNRDEHLQSSGIGCYKVNKPIVQGHQYHSLSILIKPFKSCVGLIDGHITRSIRPTPSFQQLHSYRKTTICYSPKNSK